MSAYPDGRPALGVSAQERRDEYEMRWSSGGLCLYASFTDLLFDEEANDTLREFAETKIRSVVDDPAVADTLIPDDHPILTKRLCGESGYYEAFIRDDVTLVDVRADPIEAGTPSGLRLAGGDEYELDVIICATGYDAGTGALTRIDLRGRDGRTLKEHWARGTRTHLGLMSHGFPNLFILDGPQSPSAFFSPPLLVQYQGAWIGRVIEQMEAAGASTVEPAPAAQDGWRQLVADIAAASLIPRVDSQWMGANIPGKPRECLYFLGGYRAYVRCCEQALDPAGGEFLLDGAPQAVGA